MIEKPFFAKLNTIADWIIRIILLNFFLVFSLITIVLVYPVFSAVYSLFADYVREDEPGLFSGFWKHFKKRFKRKLTIGILLAIIAVFAVFNVRFYATALAEGAGIVFQIGFVVTLMMLMGLVVLVLVSFSVVYVFPGLKLRMTARLSLLLAGKHVFRTFLLISVMFLPLAMLTLPLTTLLFMFAGASLPVLLNVLITKPMVSYLEGLKRHDNQNGH